MIVWGAGWWSGPVPQCAQRRTTRAAAAQAVLARREKAAMTRPSLVRAISSVGRAPRLRSEEHTSELQSLMRISYAVFCLKKKKCNNCTKIKPSQDSIHLHNNNSHVQIIQVQAAIAK